LLLKQTCTSNKNQNCKRFNFSLATFFSRGHEKVGKKFREKVMKKKVGNNEKKVGNNELKKLKTKKS
jgi:hypothetical protein